MIFHLFETSDFAWKISWYSFTKKQTELDSLERREWFLILNAWQQLEGVRENVINPKERCIKSTIIESPTKYLWKYLAFLYHQNITKYLYQCVRPRLWERSCFVPEQLAGMQPWFGCPIEAPSVVDPR